MIEPHIWILIRGNLVEHMMDVQYGTSIIWLSVIFTELFTAKVTIEAWLTKFIDGHKEKRELGTVQAKMEHFWLLLIIPSHYLVLIIQFIYSLLLTCSDLFHS